MVRMLRFARHALIALVSVIAIAVGLVYAVSEWKLRTTHDVAVAPVPIPTDDVSLSRGGHLAHVAGCTLCHGVDFGGAVYADMGPVGTVVGPNLTAGRGGVGLTLSDEDWVRAIRHGVRKDGTSLIVMPSEVYANLSDRDLGAVIAYIRQLPPVHRELPVTGFKFFGRALLATGRMNVLVATKTSGRPTVPMVEPGATPAYGRYLADISGCHGCHGHGLSGGRVAGPPGLPPASNLTPEGLGTWHESDFVKVMRIGQRPDGRALDEFMPWRSFQSMSDEELSALWLYLRSVPAKPSGNK